MQEKGPVKTPCLCKDFVDERGQGRGEFSRKQAKTNNVLIALKAKKEEIERFGTVFAGAFGEFVGVRHLVPRTQLGICDLFESTKVVEIEEALKVVLGEHLGASLRINLTKRRNRYCVLVFVELDATLSESQRLQSDSRSTG